MKCILDVLNDGVSGDVSEQDVLSLLNCIVYLYLCIQQTQLKQGHQQQEILRGDLTGTFGSQTGEGVMQSPTV